MVGEIGNSSDLCRWDETGKRECQVDKGEIFMNGTRADMHFMAKRFSGYCRVFRGNSADIREAFHG